MIETAEKRIILVKKEIIVMIVKTEKEITNKVENTVEPVKEDK